MAIATNTTMGFFYGDPNVTKHVWQVLFSVRDAALAIEGRRDLVLAHSGQKRGRTARIAQRRRARMHIFWTNAGQFYAAIWAEYFSTKIGS